MKPFLLSVILFFCLPPTHAQTTLDDYRRDVIEYSRRLKVAAAGSDAAAETVGQARTGYLPRLSLDGNFTATVHHYDGVERWNFSVLPQLVQVVYGGGAVRAAYRQAELGYDIALCDEEFTRLDVRYTAEYTYWNLSAMALYAASMRQYVSIIRSLKEVVDRRFGADHRAFVRYRGDHAEHAHDAAVFFVRQRRRPAHLGLIVLGVAFDVVDDVERLEYAFGPDLFGRKFARYAYLEALGTQALLLHNHQGRHSRTFGCGIEQQGLGIHLPAVGTVFGHEFRIPGQLQRYFFNHMAEFLLNNALRARIVPYCRIPAVSAGSRRGAASGLLSGC